MFRDTGSGRIEAIDNSLLINRHRHGLTHCFTAVGDPKEGAAFHPARSLRGPGLLTVDLGVSKNVGLTGGRYLQFRAEIFNVFLAEFQKRRQSPATNVRR